MRASITTSCGAALAAATLLGCGGRDAPPPPVRSSPELVLVEVTSPVSLESDPRTGVVLDGERLARLQGNVLETLATFTRAPSPVWSLSVVRYFEDAAWVGSPDETIRVEGGVTTPFAATDCDPGTDGAGLQLLDARASNNVWATILGVPTGGEVLCHFDGTAWSREVVPFGIESMVALEDALVAVDASPIPRLMRRPLAGGAWSQIPESELAESFPRVVTPTDAGAVALLVTIDGEQPAVVAPAIEILPAGSVIGLGGERWRVETLTGVAEVCSNDSISGARSCVEVIQWVQYVVSRVVGGAAEEVAHLTVRGGEVQQRALVLGPGRLAIPTSSGLFVTP